MTLSILVPRCWRISQEENSAHLFSTFLRYDPYWSFISALECGADRRKTFANSGNLNWLYQREGERRQKKERIPRARHSWPSLSGNEFTRPVIILRGYFNEKELLHCLQTAFAYSTPAFSFAASACSRSPFPSRCRPAAYLCSPVRLALIPSRPESRLPAFATKRHKCKRMLNVGPEARILAENLFKLQIKLHDKIYCTGTLSVVITQPVSIFYFN